MKVVEDRVLADGKIGEGDVLKVDSFLNHQIDIGFLCEVGREFHRLFCNCGVNKILTIEASGIGIACMTAQFFNVPVVFAKKTKTVNIYGDVYTAKALSYTRDGYYDVTVAKEFISSSDNVLIIDDFLAKGNALRALISLICGAGAKIAGVGIVIEKIYQGGGDYIKSLGIRLESLAKISSMDKTGGVCFAE